MSKLIEFSELPNATTGVFIAEDELLVSGHDNGLVIAWNTKKGQNNVLYRCSSKVETISLSSEKQVVVGSNAGDLVVIDLKNPTIPKVVQEATYNVHSRVWRTAWSGRDRLIATSTYGIVNLLTKKPDGEWDKTSLSGHSDSVFGLGSLNGGLVASGDYRGRILIWEPDGDHYRVIQSLKIDQTVEDIDWHKDESFVVVGQNGRIYRFEKIGSDTRQWRLVIEINNATGAGKCAHVTGDGKTVYVGTNSEIIQFDVDSQIVGSIEIPGARKIFSKGGSVFILTRDGFQSFERRELVAEAGLIKYRYAKISLIGHTGVGKSTLCNFVVTGHPGEMKSTFGKRVWNWILPNQDPLEKRIIFHDHGGQETVLGTFLPFLTDSDIILILFQQNDKRTFTTALKTLEQLKSSLGPKAKILLVQTYIDDPMNEIDETYVEKLANEDQITGYLRVCPSTGAGIEELKTRLMQEVSWENARIMIQSQTVDGVLGTISDLQGSNRNAVRFADFRAIYEKPGARISARHLEFVLRDLSNQGVIEYYPEVSDLIIINDKKFNELWTQIPIFVEKSKGIVSFDKLSAAFGHHEYLPILDSVYLNHGICIKNGDLRIFPEKLKDEQIVIDATFIQILKINEPKTMYVPVRKIDISRLIEALSELNLQCIDASQSDGLFTWAGNACIYYKFQRIGDAIRGEMIRWTYFIGGNRKQTWERLESEFLAIVDKLYGPCISSTQGETKKKLVKKSIKFHVALSFAGEQREYAKKVAMNLEAKGIKCFYDEFYKHKLWGTSLPEYLHEVYYSQSHYCMMFVSKDYVAKAWPAHERKSAIARQIEELGDYILPVIFDDSEIPGLQLSAIGYLDARKMSPEEVSEVLSKKLTDKEES